MRCRAMEDPHGRNAHRAGLTVLCFRLVTSPPPAIPTLLYVRFYSSPSTTLVARPPRPCTSPARLPSEPSSAASHPTSLNPGLYRHPPHSLAIPVRRQSFRPPRFTRLTPAFRSSPSLTAPADNPALRPLHPCRLPAILSLPDPGPTQRRAFET